MYINLEMEKTGYMSVLVSEKERRSTLCSMDCQKKKGKRWLLPLSGIVEKVGFSKAEKGKLHLLIFFALTLHSQGPWGVINRLGDMTKEDIISVQLSCCEDFRLGETVSFSIIPTMRIKWVLAHAET